MDGTQLEVKITEVEQRSKSNTKRLDDVENRLSEQERLVNSVSILTNEMTHFKDDLIEVKQDVKLLLNKPVKRYDAIVEKVIMCVIGAVIGFLLYKGFGI